jgi:3-hydroxyisobutyrate dehydrogenase
MSAPAPVLPPAAIAMIGLGNMGAPMAARLIEAGYRVTGYDAEPAARERFAALPGATSATELAAAAAEKSVVIAMLPDGKIVAAVADAMRPHLGAGAIMIDMSSSDPVGTRTLGAALEAAGVFLVDAPVSGGVKRAVDGSLAIMAGGDPATIDAVEPVLARMGRIVFRTGPLGSGHAMKALNNYVSGAGFVAAIEALRIGEAFGLDPAVMTDVLNASTGRNNSTETKVKQLVLSESYASGFAIGLMAKDIRTAARLADAIGVEARLAERCAALWDEAAAALGAAADHTEIGRHLRPRVR